MHPDTADTCFIILLGLMPDYFIIIDGLVMVVDTGKP